MYIFLNAGAGMSTGKAAAQAAHAGVEAYRISCGLVPHQPQEDQTPKESAVVRHWYKGGHYKKIVLRANDAQHLLTIQHYLADRDFLTALIVDEGMTEVEPHTPTALGVEVADKDHPHVAATFSTFDLYRERPSLVVLESDGRVTRDQLQAAREAAESGDLDHARRIVQGPPPPPPAGTYPKPDPDGSWRRRPLWQRFIDWLGREPK